MADERVSEVAFGGPGEFLPFCPELRSAIFYIVGVARMFLQWTSYVILISLRMYYNQISFLQWK